MRADPAVSVEAIHDNPYHWVELSTEPLADAQAEAPQAKRVVAWRYAVVGLITAAAAIALIVLGTRGAPKAALLAGAPAAPVTAPGPAATPVSVPAPVPAPVPPPAPEKKGVPQPIAGRFVEKKGVPQPIAGPFVDKKGVPQPIAGRFVRADVPEAKQVEQPAKPVPAVAVEPAPLHTASAATLLHQYQRVGRDLMKLEDKRGAEAVKDLRDEFRAINIDALTTTDARTACAETLKQLQSLIERLKGIEVSQDCLNNPLAADCR